GEFFVLASELGVFISFAKGILENLDPILGCAGRQHKWSSANSKRTLQRDDFALSVRFGKGLDFGKFGKERVRVLVALGGLHDRVNISQTFFEPVAVALQNRVRSGSAGVDLTAHQRRIEFGAAEGGD